PAGPATERWRQRSSRPSCRSGKVQASAVIPLTPASGGKIMNCIVRVLITLLLMIPAHGDVGKPSPTPAEQLKALAKEYQELLDAFEKAFSEVKSEAKRDEF